MLDLPACSRDFRLVLFYWAEERSRDSACMRMAARKTAPCLHAALRLCTDSLHAQDPGHTSRAAAVTGLPLRQ